MADNILEAGLGHLGLKLITVPLVIIVVGALVYSFIFGNSPEDFKEAKIADQKIVCEGLLNTHIFEADEYQVLHGKVVVKRFLKDKRFNVNDCSIYEG